MQETQQRPSTPQKKVNSNDGQIVLTKTQAALVNIALFGSVITHCLYIFFSTGDEVSCGTLSQKAVCYLPGVDWLGYVLVGCFAFLFVAFMLLAPSKK